MAADDMPVEAVDLLARLMQSNHDQVTHIYKELVVAYKAEAEALREGVEAALETVVYGGRYHGRVRAGAHPCRQRAVSIARTHGRLPSPSRGICERRARACASRAWHWTTVSARRARERSRLALAPA